MINEDIRHIIEAELRKGEELLWAEGVDLNQFYRLKKKWIINIFGWLGVNIAIYLLYSSGTGNFSFKTITVLLSALNCGSISLFAFEAYSDFKMVKNYNASKPRLAQIITNQRLMTLGWDEDNIKSIVQITLSDVDHYQITSTRDSKTIHFITDSTHKSSEAKFRMTTKRDISKFENILSPYLKRYPS